MKSANGIITVAVWAALPLSAYLPSRAVQAATQNDTTAAHVEEDVTAPTTVQQDEAQKSADAEGLSFHGIGYLSFKSALRQQSQFNLLLAQGEVQYQTSTWGIFATPRFKVEPLGSDNDQARLFFQQAYGFVRHPVGEIKAGKVYERFGRLWDYGFYGPLIANYDMKLQPELGVSAEGSPNLTRSWMLEYALQYFAVDGRALALSNEHFLAGRNARRSNIVVARVAPSYSLLRGGHWSVGLSASHFDVNAPSFGNVWRSALDADLALGPWNGFAEIGRQSAKDLTFAGTPVLGPYSYGWTGAMFKQDTWNLRYHYNLIRYDDGTIEQLHQPGGEYNFTENFAVMVEGAVWSTSRPQAGQSTWLERSLYVIANAKF